MAKNKGKNDEFLNELQNDSDYKKLASNSQSVLSAGYNVETERIIEDELLLNRDNRIIRNKYTTLLYRAYVLKFYQNSKDKRKYKHIIFGIMLSIAVALTILLIVCISMMAGKQHGLSEILAVIIPTCITYLGSIFGIIEIITKHVFPVDEEKYVNEMVKAIIETDLKSHIADKDNLNVRTDSFRL